jgi:hypothetical protein
VVVAVTAAVILYLRGEAKDVGVAPTTTLAAAVTTGAPPTAAPTTTTPPPPPGLGDAIVQGGTSLTPVQPLDVSGHLCLLMEVAGEPPLNFVPAEAVLVTDRPVEPALGFPTERASNTVVFGEGAPTEREVCWPVVGWRDQVTQLLYTLNGVEYRWTISDPATP